MKNDAVLVMCMDFQRDVKERALFEGKYAHPHAEAHFVHLLQKYDAKQVKQFGVQDWVDALDDVVYETEKGDRIWIESIAPRPANRKKKYPSVTFSEMMEKDEPKRRALPKLRKALSVITGVELT